MSGKIDLVLGISIAKEIFKRENPMRKTVTLFVPEGYADAADFLKDCQFERADGHDSTNLRTAVEAVVETFEKDEAQGYRSRDRQYAISILRAALSRS